MKAVHIVTSQEQCFLMMKLLSALNCRPVPVADPEFWKGEGASAQLICSPAHLNDLVSGRLFTEPGRTELGSWRRSCYSLQC